MKPVRILKYSIFLAVALLSVGAMSCKDDNGDESHFIYFSPTEPYLRIGGVACDINQITGQITNRYDLPVGTDLTQMKVYFKTNHGGGVYVNGVKQTSGVTANDFSEPVTYQVRAGGETREYTVDFTVSTTCNSQVGVKLEAYTDFVTNITGDRSWYLAPSVKVSEVEFASSNNRPLRLCLFEIDATDPTIALKSTMPFGGTDWGRQDMIGQVEALEDQGDIVLGAINGDYFDIAPETNTGEPESIMVQDGVYLKNTFDKPLEGGFFAMRTDGKAAIGNYEEYFLVQDKLYQAVGGRERLLNGGVVPQTDLSKHPRTAAGMSSDLKTIYLVVVDELNAEDPRGGISLAYLAECMIRLGASHALNLDGGGSSTFVVREEDDTFTAVNRPGGRALRAVGNGMAIVLKQ